MRVASGAKQVGTLYRVNLIPMPQSHYMNFAAKMRGELSEPELARLRAAIEFAVRYYRMTRREDGSTVLDHALAVAYNLWAAGVRDTDLLAAGILHDVIEQAPHTSPEIEAYFGPRVASLVRAVTCSPSTSAQEAIRQALEHSKEALLLRLCDRLDGVRRSKGRKPEDRQRFLAQTHATHLQAARSVFPDLAEKLDEALRTAEETPCRDACANESD